jgi:hypothetical protein
MRFEQCDIGGRAPEAVPGAAHPADDSPEEMGAGLERLEIVRTALSDMLLAAGPEILNILGAELFEKFSAALDGDALQESRKPLGRRKFNEFNPVKPNANLRRFLEDHGVTPKTYSPTDAKKFADSLRQL